MINMIRKNRKVVIILGVILFFVNVVYLYSKYQVTLEPSFSGESLSQHPLFKSKIDQTVNFVQTQGAGLPEGSFGLTGDEAEAVFEEFFENIKSSDLFRIKVWNKDYTIIWSNTAEIIGDTHLENHEVKEALDGEVEAEVKKGKAENLSERAFDNFAEVYVPIKNSGGEVVGVVETYTVTEDVVQQLRNDFYKSAAISIGISLAILMAVYFGLGYVIK